MYHVEVAIVRFISLYMCASICTRATQRIHNYVYKILNDETSLKFIVKASTPTKRAQRDANMTVQSPRGAS